MKLHNIKQKTQIVSRLTTVLFQASADLFSYEDLITWLYKYAHIFN